MENKTPRHPIDRVASAPSVPQPGESLPGSAPALAAAPVPGPAARRGDAGRHVGSVRASLRASCAEGAVSELFAACAGGAVLTAWALSLGATPLVIGLVGALPLASQVLQLPGAWLTLSFGPKVVAVVTIGASRLIWLPMVGLPFVPLTAETKLQLFVVVVAAAAILGVLGNNAWTAWMGDLVPGRIRGRFFSRRTVCMTLVGTTASLAAGMILDALTPRGWKGHALGGLSAVACLAGMVSVYLLLRQHGPRLDAGRERPRWGLIADAARDPRARPFLWYLLAWNSAVGLSASFFSYHMLSNLATGFAIAALHGVAVAAVRIVSAPLWGRAVDRFGARPVLVVCSFGIAAVPAIWLFPTPAFLWPLALEAALSGALWGGHGLAAMDLTVDLSPAQARPFYVAVFAAASGVGFAAASVLAGLVAVSLPDRFELLGQTWANLHVLFFLSAVGRAAAGFAALPIKERGALGVSEFLRVLGARAAGRLGWSPSS